MNKKFTFKGFQLLLIVLICILAGYFFGTREVQLKWQNYHPIVSIQPQVPPTMQTADFSMMFQILNQVNQIYYDKSKINAQQMVYGAISGMLATLNDPYTAFFPPQANSAFKTQMAGQFSGIGAELGLKNNKLIVVAPLDGSPAQKAGIRAGDYIEGVDGKSTTGWDTNTAVNNIRGPKGSQVVLTVVHEGQNKSVNIKITRNDIKIDSVVGWVKQVNCSGNNTCSAAKADCTSCSTVGYIRITQFGDRTDAEWQAQVNKMVDSFKKDKNVKGVILDLRDNPGGYLQDAVFIAGEFLPQGDVVVQQQDGNGQITQLKVDRQGKLLNQPLVILVDRGSASASEITSGALRDDKHALLVGDRTFGKGIVQQAIDLENGASVHITVAKWLTPNGTWVGNGKDGEGLKPDVEVKYDPKKSPENGFDNQLQTAIQQLVK